jgi:hypothetical protein
MGSYQPSTIDAIGKVTTGVVLQTPVFSNATWIADGATSIFTVNGRIRILSLDLEAVTAFSDTATLLKWQFDLSSPAVATFDITGAALTCATIAQGRRVSFQGTALNTDQVISANPGCSLETPNTLDIGCLNSVGTLDIVGDVAATSGTSIITLCYVPITDGAHVVNIIT